MAGTGAILYECAFVAGEKEALFSFSNGIARCVHPLVYGRCMGDDLNRQREARADGGSQRFLGHCLMDKESGKGQCGVFRD